MKQTKLEDLLLKLRNAGITPTAASYARFSSDNQRDESIDAQQRAIREFAKTHKIIIAHEYVDRAKSATSDDREDFQRMILDSAGRTFQFVIVHKLDRFSRNRADSLGYRVQLKKNGVQLISVIEQFDPDTPEGALMEGMVELMAEFYSRNLSREVLKGLKENALAAKFNGGIPPYGYDVDPTSQKYVVNASEAPAVQLIFNMLQKRHSYEEILQELHKRGYRTKLGNYFTRSGLYEILRNPRYTGLYIYRRVASQDYLTKTRNNHLYNVDPIKVENGIPAIISEELFVEVQKVLDARKSKRRRHSKEKYLLSGKIYCGECQRAYAGDRTTLRSGKLHITYRCDSRKNKVGRTCTNKSIQRDCLELAVISYLKDIIFNEQLIPMLLERYNEALARANQEITNQLNSITAKLNGVKKSICKIVRAIELSNSRSLLSRLAELESLQDQLEKQQAEIVESNAIKPVTKEKLTALVNSAKLLMDQDDFPARRRLIETFIEKVLVYHDRVEIHLNAAPFVKNGDYAKYKQIISRQ